MARDDAQVNFRIPHELNERLKASAAANKRSVTAELVSRLQKSLDDDARALAPSPEFIASVLGDAELAKALAQIGALGQQASEIANRITAKVKEQAVSGNAPKRAHKPRNLI